MSFSAAVHQEASMLLALERSELTEAFVRVITLPRDGEQQMITMMWRAHTVQWTVPRHSPPPAVARER